jgi:hypothetical protein
MINLSQVLKIYKEKRIKLISESKHRQIWEVDKHTIMIQIKKGRRTFTCDCENHARYCSSSVLCRHKEAVMAFKLIAEFQKQLDEFEKTLKALRLTEDQNLINNILSELDDIQKLRWLKQLEKK